MPQVCLRSPDLLILGLYQGNTLGIWFNRKYQTTVNLSCPRQSADVILSMPLIGSAFLGNAHLHPPGSLTVGTCSNLAAQHQSCSVSVCTGCRDTAVQIRALHAWCCGQGRCSQPLWFCSGAVMPSCQHGLLLAELLFLPWILTQGEI